MSKVLLTFLKSFNRFLKRFDNIDLQSKVNNLSLNAERGDRGASEDEIPTVEDVVQTKMNQTLTRCRLINKSFIKSIFEQISHIEQSRCGLTIIPPLTKSKYLPKCGKIKPMMYGIFNRILLLWGYRNICFIFGNTRPIMYGILDQMSLLWRRHSKQPIMYGMLDQISRNHQNRPFAEHTRMKAVIHEDQKYFKVIDNVQKNNDIGLFRPTLRNVCKNGKVSLNARDREPSRISIKNVLRIFKKRKSRKKFRKSIMKSTPLSSKLCDLVLNYKLWRIHSLWREMSSFSSFVGRYYNIKRVKSFQKFSGNSQQTVFRTRLYDVNKRNIVLSGDVELNPGPRRTCHLTEELIPFNASNFLLNYRLLRYNLKSLDVGGGGDCFFKSIAHQLYGDPRHHLEIRAAGVKYLTDNPERFIESNTEVSWLRYITNMSLEGTWADHMIIQAVADTMNLKINIIESDENFSATTIVEPVIATENTTSVFIGHIGEMHYVSTISISCQQNDSQQKDNYTLSNVCVDKSMQNPENFQSKHIFVDSNSSTQVSESVSSETLYFEKPAQKSSRAAYMREYRKRKTSLQIRAKANESKRKYRASKICSKERAKISQYMKQYRTKKASPDQKHKLNEYQKQYNRKKRSNPEERAKINEYQKQYRAKTDSPEKKSRVNQYQKDYYRTKRTCPEKRAKINEYKKKCYRKKRACPQEKEHNYNYMKKCKVARGITISKKSPSIDILILNFHKLVNKGPLYVCTCCDQLWYKHSVSQAKYLRQSKPEIIQYLFNKISVDDKEWVCRTCYSYLNKYKVPPCSIANGIKFPEKPAFFDLNELECRLVAPRIAFQKLMQAPRGKQLKIHGNVVNVPADVNHTVCMLPRLQSQTSTIKIHLKRKLQYKSSALSLNVRPYKVIQAANWLVNNSKLYKDEGIVFDIEWINKYNEEIAQNENENKANFSIRGIDSENNVNIDDNNNIDNEEETSEDEGEAPAGVIDTMLTPTDFVEDNERQNILNIAPSEGNRPLSIFRDQYSEELAYPGIFLGQARLDNKQRLVKVNYSDICKSELRHSDRRAAMCVENIFFKTKKLQMKILLGKSNIAMRKCKGNNPNLNAGHLKQEGALDRLIRLDEGYKFLNALRGSPPYFEKAKKDLFAMIRQLGPATLFCSFSSAETRWLHLLCILGQLVDNKLYSDDQLESLDWENRCRLIQSDPVTCARHFDYQVNQFLTNFLLSSTRPLGKISDWFYRVEYQQRGSPHIHMLIWLENAPEFKVDSDEQVTSYIDNIITAQRPLDDAELNDLVNGRQIHKHCHTCRKNTKSQCRFNYPQPPMRKTMIVYPFDDDTSDIEIKNHKNNWKTIKKYLDEMIEGEHISFDQLLLNLNVTEENYLKAISSSVNTPTVFLKRNPNELRVNNYNPACLKAWRANMDIQFVLDVYGCAVYIVNYISKGQKGMSELLRQACSEARQGNLNIKQQVRDIGSKFVNNVEISAQEAVYIALQLPFRKASRNIIFINTSPPDERVELLKPMNDIKEMHDDDEEIYTSGLIKRYCKRPALLENLTLADWAAWYDCTGKRYIKQTCEIDIDGLPLESFVDDNQNDDEYQLKTNNTKKTRKRTKARIIRCVWFNKESDPEKHYRELLMLFTSWRNEQIDLLCNCCSYKERFLSLQNEIEKQMKQYAVCTENFNEMQLELRRIEERYDTIAPGTESIEQEDTAEGNQDLHPDFNENYHLSDDLGIPSADNTEPLIMNELPDDEYRHMVQTLNKEQKEFFYHVLHMIKTSDEPFYCFLSGGAGVGKSHVTKACYQAAIKYYNSRAGTNFTETKVLILAPTGKASYNIKGNTIHSALAIPACQSLRNYKKLDSGRLNTLRCQIGKVKLIFVDEISMVGNTMFNVQFNNRLKDIKGSSLPFGGVSIVAIGDLFQLQPVMDGYIFKEMDNFEYGILAPNFWVELFEMFELKQIMRQRESKAFAEMLNRLREGHQTEQDIKKFKERIISCNSTNYPRDAPHLFIQNAKVNKFNLIAHNALPGEKYSIKAHDSVIGAESQNLREKILKQVPNDPRKTKQLYSVLKLAVGERTEISLNTRIDDGITNGAGNVVKLLQIHNTGKPSGIIWVQFDHADIGAKTRHDNRQLYGEGIQSSWTPIKPITTQFGVGRNRTVQVVRKQFPLRPAAAKTIHRSQGDTETKIVANFETKRAIPHIHYVGLSRVTTIEGLHITDFCEEKISVSNDVKKEMERLRTKGQLKLSILPIYAAQSINLKLCALNCRSLHKHIDDVRNDFNFSATDINFFFETRFIANDNNCMYSINGYDIFRNDATTAINERPYGGTVIYTRLDYYPGYPQIHNNSSIEITATRFMILPHVTIIGMHKPPGISNTILCAVLTQELQTLTSEYAIFIGDFNVNWLNAQQRSFLYNFFINDNNYRQLISSYTTDNKTCIDHIYTNLPDSTISCNVLETYFSDHKAIYALINCF